MLLIKCRLKRLITLDSNDHTVLFTDQIFMKYSKRNTRPSTCFNTHGRAFQTLGRAVQSLGRAFQTLGGAFEALRENKKPGQEFEKLGRVFVLQHDPCCPNQPRYPKPSKTQQNSNGEKLKIIFECQSVLHY